MIRHSFVKIGIVPSILVLGAAKRGIAQVIAIRGGTLTFEGAGAGRLDIFGNQGFTRQASMSDGA